MKTQRNPLTIIGLITAVICVGFLSLGFESYCFIYPEIDTRYTPGFTEAKFAEVRLGMSKEDVVRLLGDPFGGPAERDSSYWSYTQDGKSRWGDWAWLGRHIVFREGVVAEKINCVWYD